MGDKHSYTLEQLATATGMTPRNVRAYQTRGLISRPLRDGRRSVYGPHHVQQLLDIQRARAGGASLGLISGVIADGGRISGDGLSWATRPYARKRADGEARRSDLQPVLERIGSADPAQAAPVQQLVDQLTRLGLIRRRGGRTLIRRDLATSMIALHQQGLPPAAVLAIMTQVAMITQPLTRAVLEALETSAGGVTPAVVGHAAELAAGMVHEALSARLPPDE